jgi:hypothetical protein
MPSTIMPCESSQSLLFFVAATSASSILASVSAPAASMRPEDALLRPLWIAARVREYGERLNECAGRVRSTACGRVERTLSAVRAERERVRQDAAGFVEHACAEERSPSYSRGQVRRVRAVRELVQVRGEPVRRT